MLVVITRAWPWAAVLIVPLLASSLWAPASTPPVRPAQPARQVDSAVDAETRAQVESWLADFCATVVGRPMFSRGVMESMLEDERFVDLAALGAGIEERARARDGVLLPLRKNLREAFVSDFVFGDPVRAQHLLQLERRDDGLLLALVYVIQGDGDWSMWLLLEPRADDLVVIDWMTPVLGMWTSDYFLEFNWLDRLPEAMVAGQILEVVGFAAAGQFDLAHEQLDGVVDLPLPGTFDSFRADAAALVYWARDEIELAEQAVERALQCEHVAPLSHYLAALLADDRGDHAATLQHARSFLVASPGDPDAVLLEGWALLGLGQAEQAAQLAPRVLALRPDDTGALQLAFLAWASVGSDRHEQAVRALAELLAGRDDPRSTAFKLSEEVWDHDDPVAALELLAQAVEQAGCCGEFPIWARARAAWWHDDWPALIELLGPRIGTLSEPDVVAECVDLLIEAHMAQGEPLAAYELPVDRTLAFRSVTERLIDTDEDDALAALVASYEREPQAAGDPWLDYVRGVIWELSEDARKAELSYASAHMNAGDDLELAERALDARLFLRWMVDDLVGAYDEIEPQAEVLARLLEWCDDDDDAEGLAALLDVHAADDRPHGDFPAAEVQLLLLSGEDERARDELLMRRASLCEVWDVETWERRTLECLLRLGEHDEALELARASTARDGDPYFEIIAQAVIGDAEATQAALEAWLEIRPWEEPETIWYEPLIAEALRGEALAELAARYPEPEG